jgi:ubiquinol-cytochrome c reductase cytochrome b subunit/menaquinol-cytochrome c reductase cytochrome b/c subunit
MSLVVVSVIAGLAALWYFTSGEEAGEAGILGPRYTEEADPGTTSFVPRPDWYFFFLFYLLRIFKWPESVILGTVGIPTILMILLFAVPFLDRRRERRLVRRPVAIVASLLLIASMGVLTYKGATAEEPGGESAAALLEANDLPADDEALTRGAQIFAEAGCTSCHTYAGQGAAGPGPELTDVGSRLAQDAIAQTVENGRGGMPAFGDVLTDEQIQDVSGFLAASGASGGGE